MLENMYTAEEAAARLGITVSAVHRLCARGVLGSMWCAGRRLFHKVSIEKYLSDPRREFMTRRTGRGSE